MRRFNVMHIITLCLVAVVLCAVTFSAWAKREAKYVGSEECSLCHEDTHGTMLQAFAKTHHRKAMADAEENPEAIVAKFGDDAPFKKEDIKYVLGTGTAYQNYLDKDLKVLPGKWDTKAQKWVKVEAEDGATQCVGCHATNYDPEAKTWTELGVGCEMCHGPGGAHSESMDAADIVNPKSLDGAKRNMICGQCHAFGTDPSGKLAFSATFIPGQDLKDHFKIKEIGDRTQNVQYNTFITSKHAEGGMLCTSCHDSHGDKAKASHQLRRPINDLCIACHKAKIGSMKEHAPKAKADDTCATCHMINASHAFKKAKPIE